MFKFDSKAYFRSRLNKYKDRDPSHIPKELIDQLDEYMQKYLNFPPASEIREMPLDLNGHRYSKTSFEVLKNVLKCTNNSKYYSDMNLIAKVLWNWEIINEEIIRKLEEEHTKLEEIYGKRNISIPYNTITLKPPTESIIEEFKRMYDELS